MTSNSYRFLGLFLVMVSLYGCSTEEPVSTSGMVVQDSLPVEPAALSITSVSTKPWLVTGGDVMLEVQASAQFTATDFQLSHNGQLLDAQFNAVGNGRYQVLVTQLPEGDSEIELTVENGIESASLMVTNYPISGPIISGPHEQPFQCETENFEMVNGEALGLAQDANCFAPTRVVYVYWSNDGQGYVELDLSASADWPEDIDTLQSASGAEIPFIVRVETGTVNRAVYEIAMLHDPRDGALDPWTRSPYWNGKLVYTHGGGCRAGWHRQGDRSGGVMRPGLFVQGYATVSSTLNVFGQNCNDLLASETHIMVKERFIEHYGVPEYTIATGASGGSYQSHQTADNYPGVFDGIIVAASFPDVTSATIFTVADARLLHHYFNTINPDAFSEAQQQAVAGFGSFGSIANLSRGAARLDPLFSEEATPESQGGELGLPELEVNRYSPDNPTGLRATVYDHTVNVYGHLDGSQIALRPLDNVGVQYGLAALNEGSIDTEQFIALNRDIGGFDRDMNHVPERHRADSLARRRAIESGRILHGGAGLASTPVIDYRSYTDHAENGDIHMIVHQFSTRQRLRTANGHADNHVMRVGGRWGFSDDAPDLAGLFLAMDDWLTGINADADVDRAVSVVRNKPQTLNDACWDNTGEERVLIEEPLTYTSSGRCGELYPAYSTPRHVAGAPLANDIVSCRLRALNPADYTVTFTPEQFLELRQIFSSGVCDWSVGDASGTPYQGTWQSFGPSPVNRM